MTDQLNENSALVAGQILHRSLCLEDAAELKGDRYLHDLIYLAIFLENFVLHDKIVVFDHPNLDDKYFHENEQIRVDSETAFKTRLSRSNIFLPLFESGIIQVEETSFEKDSDRVVSLMSLFDDFGMNVTPYEAWALDDILFAQKRNLSFVTDHTKHAKTAQDFAGRLEREALSLLQRSYGELSDSLKSDLNRLAEARREHIVYFPPLAAIILDRCTRVEDIPRHALEVREEFGELRAGISKYENIIRDDSLPLEKSLAALNHFEAAVGAVTKKHDTSVATKISEWKDFADLEKLSEGMTGEGAATLTKLVLGMPLQVVNAKIKSRRLSYLNAVRTEFLSIKNYNQIATKVFGREIEDRDVKYVQEVTDTDLRQFILK